MCGLATKIVLPMCRRKAGRQHSGRSFPQISLQNVPRWNRLPQCIVGFWNGYLMELDGKPHCIAWWSAARDANMAGYAELICLHSLQENWRKGYGRAMMERVLADVKKAGYEKLVLWVFENNTRAIQFYKSFGFEPSGRRRPALGAVEEMYSKPL